MFAAFLLKVSLEHDFLAPFILLHLKSAQEYNAEKLIIFHEEKNQLNFSENSTHSVSCKLSFQIQYILKRTDKILPNTSS